MHADRKSMPDDRFSGLPAKKVDTMPAIKSNKGERDAQAGAQSRTPLVFPMPLRSGDTA
jgi:hypothetical protein